MERLKELFGRLMKIDILELEKKCKSYEFAEEYRLLERMYEKYSRLENEHIFYDPLPETNKETIKNNLRTFVEIAEGIINLDPKRNDFSVARNRLIQKTTESYQNSYNFMRDFRIYLVEKDLKNLEGKATLDELEIIKNETEDALNTVKQMKNKISEILEASQEASGEIGISEHAEIFEKEAIEKEKTASKWLKRSLGSFFFLFGIIIWIIFELITNSGSEGFVSYFMRVLLVSFASILVYQFLKNYNASMHQYSINKHRANSLRTFKVFYEGTDSTEIKNAILLAATKAVFEAGDTGYVSKKDKSSSLDLVTNIIPKDK